MTETNINPTLVTMLCIKGMSKTIMQILQPYNNWVAQKLITTLLHLLTIVKEKDDPNNRQVAVYKIKCSDCQASYIRETGNSLNTRMTKHKWVMTSSIMLLNTIDFWHELLSTIDFGKLVR